MLEVEFDSSKDLAFGWNMMFGSFTKMLQFVEQIVSQESIRRACFRPKPSALKIHQSVSCNLDGHH